MIRVNFLYLPQCRLKVTFNDGVSGVYPVEPERRDGVFLKMLYAQCL